MWPFRHDKVHRMWVSIVLMASAVLSDAEGVGGGAVACQVSSDFDSCCW